MEYVGQRGPLTGMTKTFVQLIKNEGPYTLYSGLTPALLRSFVYGGLRLGLYEPCKYVSDSAFGHTTIVTKFASGAVSGSLATALTNPTEILKVRLQMKKGSRSKGSVHELSQIVAAEGVAGLWKGVGPAMARAAALTATQLATYDESKQALIRWTSLEEGFILHLSASTIAGIMVTLATAPIDTVKTRLMMQKESAKIGNYKNGFHCAYKIFCFLRPAHNINTQRHYLKICLIKRWSTLSKRISEVGGQCCKHHLIHAKLDKMEKWALFGKRGTSYELCVNTPKTYEGKLYADKANNCLGHLEVMVSEGLQGLYKGSTALFARLGPQTAITFLVCEKLREFAGMKAL